MIKVEVDVDIQDTSLSDIAKYIIGGGIQMMCYDMQGIIYQEIRRQLKERSKKLRCQDKVDTKPTKARAKSTRTVNQPRLPNGRFALKVT